MNTIFTAKHLKAFLNGILDMAFLMKVEKDRFIYSMLNSSAQKATGLTENVVGKALEDVLPPEIAYRLTDKYRMVAVTKQALTYEDINLLSQERFPAETTLTPICDEEGECAYILAITKDITDRKRKEASLKFWESFMRETGDPILIVRIDQVVMDVNPAFENMFGWTREEIIGQHRRQFPLIPVYLRKEVNEIFAQVGQGKVIPSYETMRQKKDGSMVYVSTTYSPIYDEWGEVVAVTLVYRDITDQKKAESALNKALKELKDIKFALDESAIVAITDTNGIITYANEMFCQISKYDREELIGQPHSIVNSGYHPKAFFAGMWSTIRKGKVWCGEIKNKAKDGSYYWVKTTIVPLLNEHGQPYQYISIRTDITDRKYIEEELYRREEKLKYMAYHDILTGLPNRRMFYKILKEEINKAKRYGDHFAVLYLDCDDFKNINDTLGHDGGDAFLKHFANALTSCVRSGDVVARIGGDEFVILLSKMNTEKEGAEVAGRILHALKKPKEINGCELTATSSIGISFYRGGEMSEDELLKQADQALYEAKAQGRNRYAFFME